MNALDLYVFRIWLKSNKSVMAHIVKDIARHGLTLENFMVMELLYSKGPHPIQQMSETLHIASGSITNVVNKLESKGLVARCKRADNRRYCDVALTAEGQAMFQTIFPQHHQVISNQLDVLTEEEKQQLAQLLKKVGIHAEKRLS